MRTQRTGTPSIVLALGALLIAGAGVSIASAPTPPAGGTPPSLTQRVAALEDTVVRQEAEIAQLRTGDTVLTAKVDALSSLKGVPGPQGPKGEAGPRGPQGPAGPSGSGPAPADECPFTVDKVHRAVTLAGYNLYVVNGSGSTHVANGLGNLILGYSAQDPKSVASRTGSHNLILGDDNQYDATSGIVAGEYHSVEDDDACAIGGSGNYSWGYGSVVIGGQYDTAGGDFGVVAGGQNIECDLPACFCPGPSDATPSAGG